MSSAELFQALVLGIVQGLTEFLPISSSAHLILIPDFFGWRGIVDTLSFDIALHLGTTVALLYYFWNDWVKLITAFFKNLRQGVNKVWSDSDSRLFILLILGSIPAGLIGFVLEGYIETNFRNPLLIAIVLIVFALVLYLADTVSKKTRSMENIGWVDALVVGISQTLALVPGVSRSGITISTGLFRSLDRASATRFSFLLSTPIIVAASVYSLKDIAVETQTGNWDIFLVGFLASTVSGWLAIKVLLNYVKSNNFNIFVIYRVLLGLGIILLLLVN